MNSFQGHCTDTSCQVAYCQLHSFSLDANCTSISFSLDANCTSISFYLDANCTSIESEYSWYPSWTHFVAFLTKCFYLFIKSSLLHHQSALAIQRFVCMKCMKTMHIVQYTMYTISMASEKFLLVGFAPPSG